MHRLPPRLLSAAAAAAHVAAHPSRAVVALDVGSVHTGVAVSDAGSRSLAVPSHVLHRVGSASRPNAAHALARGFADVLAEHRPCLVVAGWPLEPSGREGPQCVLTAKRLTEMLEGSDAGAGAAPPVVLWDERFSTMEAYRQLDEANVRRKRRRERLRDAVSAAVVLQSFLDAHVAGDGEFDDDEEGEEDVMRALAMEAPRKPDSRRWKRERGRGGGGVRGRR